MSESAILVVDDDPSILDAVADVLREEGYAVETAQNGHVALQVIERGLPSLVPLDMRMPIVDGWTFAQRLHERNIELPILVMTAAQDAAGWAREIGARGLVAKPFSITDLLDAVERHRSPAA